MGINLISLLDFILTEKDFLFQEQMSWASAELDGSARPSERYREVAARVVALRPFLFQILYFR